MTDCFEVQAQIMDFIDGNLSEEETAQFLDHVNSCEACKDELNIYYTVYLGLRQLNHDEEFEELQDITAAVEELLQSSADLLKRGYMLRVIRYALYTVVFWSVTISGVLLFELLIRMGIL